MSDAMRATRRERATRSQVERKRSERKRRTHTHSLPLFSLPVFFSRLSSLVLKTLFSRSRGRGSSSSTPCRGTDSRQTAALSPDAGNFTTTHFLLFTVQQQQRRQQALLCSSGSGGEREQRQRSNGERANGTEREERETRGEEPEQEQERQGRERGRARLSSLRPGTSAGLCCEAKAVCEAARYSEREREEREGGDQYSFLPCFQLFFLYCL